MNSRALQAGFTRRQLLKGGLWSAVGIVAGGWLAVRLTDVSPGASAPLKYLGAAEQLMFAKLADASLSDVLPAEAAAHQQWLGWITQNVDAAINLLPLALQRETKKLTSMLTFAPTRTLLTGQWTGWAKVERAELQAHLEAMRQSDNNTRLTVYRVVHDLVMAGFYGDRRSWPLIGYSGPVYDNPKNG